MPHRTSPFLNPLRFSEADIELLARTADALSAWLGKPVLAEVMDASETGYEWVVFGIPLLPDEDAQDRVLVQIGGAGSALLGNRGGLGSEADNALSCEFLWGIQLTSLQGVRYIKVDHDGEEIAWTDNLHEILPFDLNEPPEPPADPDDLH